MSKAQGKDSKKGGLPPGKDGKNQPEVKEEQPVDPAPQMQQIDVKGFGRFEYINGTVYEGQWELINGIKVKQGEGVLRHGTASKNSGNEWYEGSWHHDKMQGYGVYYFTSGAVYSGQWANGHHHGKGVYEFPNGSKYEGEWKNNKMHGEGVFTDVDGNRWEGEFVEGVYKSKLQKQLKMEKLLKKKEEEILASAKTFFTKFEQAFSISDKKTFKENLLPFFATSDEVKGFVKDPFPKFEERPPDKWNDSMKFLSQPTFTNIPRTGQQAKILDPNNIFSAQFNGSGQIAEFMRETPERTAKIVICNVIEQNWVIVYFHDTAPIKQQLILNELILK